MASIFKRGDRSNYRLSYIDHQGRRREISSHTTDKRTAERIAAKREAEVALLREGVVDIASVRLADQNRKPLAGHVADYLAHCKRAELSPQILKSRARHLRWIQEFTGATRLSDLTAEALEHARADLRARGHSAQSANGRQESVRAFLNCCVRNGRATSNPLLKVTRLNVDADRRYIRRPLTEAELQRLFEVAKEKGRLLFYAMAFYAGIRRGELGRLRWGDVDLTAGTLTIRRGKAKRTDVIPLHPDLKAILEQERPANCHFENKVFPEIVTNKTRVLDFERAEIPLVDAQGLRADLHSTRMTLHTMLALGGVPVQVAQRLLRHADYRTTQKHYFHMDAGHARSALRALPSVRPAVGQAQEPKEECQQKHHKTPRTETPSGASPCSSEEDAIDEQKRANPLESAHLCKPVPLPASRRASRRSRRRTALGKTCSVQTELRGRGAAMVRGAPGRGSRGSREGEKGI